MASLKVALMGVGVTVLLAPTMESGTLTAPWLGLDDSNSGPASVPVLPDVPELPPEPVVPEPPSALPGKMVPSTTELEANGLVVVAGLLTVLTAPGSGSNSALGTPGLAPPPEPHAVKPKNTRTPKIPAKIFKECERFFMALACAFQSVTNNAGTKSHG
jgi:hypothetical protein